MNSIKAKAISITRGASRVAKAISPLKGRMTRAKVGAETATKQVRFDEKLNREITIKSKEVPSKIKADLNAKKTDQKPNYRTPKSRQSANTPTHATRESQPDISSELSSVSGWSDLKSSEMTAFFENSDEPPPVLNQPTISEATRPAVNAAKPADLKTLDDVAKALIKDLPKRAANNLTLEEMARNQAMKEAKLNGNIDGLKSLGKAARDRSVELKTLLKATQSQRDCFTSEEWKLLEKHANEGNYTAYGDAMFDKAFALGREIQKMDSLPAAPRSRNE